MASYRSSFSILFCILGFAIVVSTGEVMDNRDTCAHRVVNCDPNVDHFDTKISMEHSSSVTKLDYKNTYALLEQSWPTRGPWMKSTSQRVVFVRCGCPVPSLSAEWNEANIIHVPVSSVMVQMPTTLSKLYMMGQRSKVVAIESNRYVSDATPELVTDIRDGIIRRLDLSPDGTPSSIVKLSFPFGSFPNSTSGFRLKLIDDNSSSIMGETECFFPADDSGSSKSLKDVLQNAFNSIQGWVEAGKMWVLTKGDASTVPSTSLSYTLYFDKQLQMGLSLDGESITCGSDVSFNIERDYATSKEPIYYRLGDLPGGFPDVLITEPRSLGPLADDPKVFARRFIDSDPGEATPLGRAELLKLIALITGSEATSNDIFGMISSRYKQAKDIAMKARHRPTVMVGKPGTWNEAARKSWMITVGSTYVGQNLKDANVDYRNSEDDVNKKLCGTGCGVCPSGQSDTRCSVHVNEYLELFRSADYWISAGIGANCWSASCNFQITSDKLLNENRDIFSQFLPMQCGTVIGLDKSHGVNGNTFWETGRLRPDLVLMDLVTLMHPDIEIKEETTFFRMLPPASNMTGVSSCPRTLLPERPEIGTVHVSSIFTVKKSIPPSEIIGAFHFTIIDKFYPETNVKIAKALNVNVADLEIAVANEMMSESSFALTVTVRVRNCSQHSCGVQIGEKLDTAAPDIQKAFGLNWVSVQRATSRSILVTDNERDVIPLTDLVKNEHKSSSGDKESISAGTIAGIVIGASVTLAIALFVTYKTAFARGVKYEKCIQSQQFHGAGAEHA